MPMEARVYGLWSMEEIAEMIDPTLPKPGRPALARSVGAGASERPSLSFSTAACPQRRIKGRARRCRPTPRPDSSRHRRSVPPQPRAAPSASTRRSTSRSRAAVAVWTPDRELAAQIGGQVQTAVRSIVAEELIYRSGRAGCSANWRIASVSRRKEHAAEPKRDTCTCGCRLLPTDEKATWFPGTSETPCVLTTRQILSASPGTANRMQGGLR